ncbi:MAG: sporulation protein YqfC [Xylanivirga thermophila]|jgi:sporulation protein YqfC|uniref:sporulation protein YqfC n=1 Tax=Xylanivirga thermophila TaxID=2496273 RepID=UPI00101C4B20|nr:sporulation protein YqfC [Xylanivirga thermophila]
MNKKRLEDVKNKMSEAFELPKEITLDLPKISMVGNMQMLVENHKGIIEYTPERVRVNSTNGVIRVQGEGLNLRNIAVEDIMITGSIRSIEFM